ncbi:MAG TPA: 4-hydroxy-3-methylbut-2-enyl diphosphate reductase [Verrucomicrobiae bacterium]|jgi:4-hydroxy-3-methylbut-2-enyl diphosphate reductase|nr:4-hydroxy-3-methylbut-2-enyl diphosphate reductase [Verrucomicrobiae bacterium]
MNTIAHPVSDYFAMQSVVDAPAPARAVRIQRAAHLGMCFGVRDAIALALDEAAKQPLTILGDLVHNADVTAQLRARGIQTEHQPATVKTPAVMITAHGASDKTMQGARAQGLHVLEATCPLVHYAHRAVRQLAAAGFHPIIIGQRGHVEVRGLTEDLAACDIILTDEDVAGLAPHPRLGVAAQTTQPIDRVRALVALLRQRFPQSEVRFIDTVCQPTKLRQSAAAALAQASDVVIVVGGASSNNTRELVQTCSRHCARVHHVQQAKDLRAEWLAHAVRIGLTAGTSTPDFIINEVEDRLRALVAA